MRRLPPLTALEAFVQVARLGSVKAAAAELALSTPALSRRVQALERYLNLVLFDRKHQHMELNADGLRLMQEIAPVLDSLSVAIDDVLRGGRELRLRLGVLPLFASQRLMPRLGDLKRDHPDLHIEIDTSPMAIVRLGDGLDAAIILTRDLDPALHAQVLDDDDIYLIARATRGEGADAIRKPSDLTRETLLFHRDMPTMFEVWRNAIGMPDLAPKSTEYYDSGQLMLEAAAQDLGVAVMHSSHFRSAHDPRLVRLFSDVEVPSPYHYYYVCRPRALDNKAVRLFGEWLDAVKL